VDLPWWVWVLLALWCAPGLYGTVALLLMKPIGGLTEEGERPRRPSLLRKLLLAPLVLVVLVGTWPLVLWSEFRNDDQ
jgi:hypothetical protein